MCNLKWTIRGGRRALGCSATFQMVFIALTCFRHSVRGPRHDCTWSKHLVRCHCVLVSIEPGSEDRARLPFCLRFKPFLIWLVSSRFEFEDHTRPWFCPKLMFSFWSSWFPYRFKSEDHARPWFCPKLIGIRWIRILDPRGLAPWQTCGAYTWC